MFSSMKSAFGMTSKPTCDPKVGDTITFKAGKIEQEGEILKRMGMRLRVKTAEKEVWAETKDVIKVHVQTSGGAEDSNKNAGEKEAQEARDKAEADAEAAKAAEEARVKAAKEAEEARAKAEADAAAAKAAEERAKAEADAATAKRLEEEAAAKEAEEARAKAEADAAAAKAAEEARVKAEADAATAKRLEEEAAAKEAANKATDDETEMDDEMTAMYQTLLEQAKTHEGKLTFEMVKEWDQVKEILAAGTVGIEEVKTIFQDSFREAAVGDQAFSALPPGAMAALSKAGGGPNGIPRRVESDSESEDETLPGEEDDDFEARLSKIKTLKENGKRTSSKVERSISKEAFKTFVVKLDEASEIGEVRQTRIRAASSAAALISSGVGGSILDKSNNAKDVNAVFKRRTSLQSYTNTMSSPATPPPVAPAPVVKATPPPVVKATPPPPVAPEKRTATADQMQRLSELTQRLSVAEVQAKKSKWPLTPDQQQRFDALLVRLKNAEMKAGVKVGPLRVKELFARLAVAEKTLAQRAGCESRVSELLDRLSTAEAFVIERALA
jgi:hypothetical protein